MTLIQPTARVAVIGAGIAGASCASSLRQAGMHVELFDKSRGVGGRMASRRVQWTDPAGKLRTAELDHGAQHFSALHPRFRAMLASAEAAGKVAPWRAKIHSTLPVPRPAQSYVAVPAMSALVRHLVNDLAVRLEQPVQRLHRGIDGWHLVHNNDHLSGPYDHVMLAMPAPQAALLLAGHHDDWANTLAAVRMATCWTLLAVTDDIDWPWDAALPAQGPLDWVARNDRKPGRPGSPDCATWVAHATADWSMAHVEDEPDFVASKLSAALRLQMPHLTPVNFHHASVHRWRYAASVGHGLQDPQECWWDRKLGIGVCGDFFGKASVEAAWRSGDELADTVAASLDLEPMFAVDPTVPVPQVAARPIMVAAPNALMPQAVS